MTGSVEGGMADPPSSATAIDAPGVPGKPSVELTGDREVTLSWSTPAARPETPVTSYTVLASIDDGPYAALSAGDCDVPATNHCVARGLTGAATYRFRVAAVNQAATGDPSAPSDAVVVLGTPDAPVLTAVTPGAASATVRWTLPAAAGAVTGYIATANPGGHTCRASEGTATTCLLDELTNGTAYTVTVVATGPFGTASAPSNPLPVTPSVAPGRPAGPTLTAGVASIVASWAPPADAGSGISGYTVVAQPGPATCSTTGATNCTLGAAAGTTYRVTVVAHGAYGRDSLVSEPAGLATAQAPPVPATPPATSVRLTTDHGKIAAASPRQSIVLVGSGFAPYSTVTIVVYSAPSRLASVVADANGNFSQPVTVPGSLSGSHTFVALGVDPSGAPHTAALVVRIQAGSLPVTGLAVSNLLNVALALTLAGTGLLGAARIRPRYRDPEMEGSPGRVRFRGVASRRRGWR
jgi:titin